MFKVNNRNTRTRCEICYQLPIHVILGISDYTKLKTQEWFIVTVPEEPIAELTNFGWVIVSPGQETGVTNMLFSKTS